LSISAAELEQTWHLLMIQGSFNLEIFYT
jgi:hypothetical protein